MKIKRYKTFLVAALFISVGNIYSMDWPIAPRNQNYVWGNEKPTDHVLIEMTDAQSELFDAIIRVKSEQTQQLLEENQHEQNRPLSVFENFLRYFGINCRQPDILTPKSFQRFLIVIAKDEALKKNQNIRETLQQYIDDNLKDDLNPAD